MGPETWIVGSGKQEERKQVVKAAIRRGIGEV